MARRWGTRACQEEEEKSKGVSLVRAERSAVVEPHAGASIQSFYCPVGVRGL
jgi:hypothetical protein